MTRLHENTESVKGRRIAELWWPLQNAGTEHNPLQMSVLGRCVGLI